VGDPVHTTAAKMTSKCQIAQIWGKTVSAEKLSALQKNCEKLRKTAELQHLALG
jgi:hypothetical protein